jgi:hypothetical protein
MTHTPEAAAAIASPPSCITGFRYSALPAGKLDLAAEFELACKTCGQAVFQILAYPLLVPEPSPYFGLEPGETLNRPPHRLRCTSCGTEAPLFDARTQGYDGVLNGGCACESGGTGETPIPGEFKIVAAFLYNIEMAELEELAAEANVKPSDLFDAFGFTGSPANGGQEVDFNYECA